MNSSLPGSTDKLYSISEAARILGIHPSTLRLWESQGLISPDRTPGGDRRYRLGDLQALLSRKSDGRLKENGGGVPPEERSYTISEAAQFLGVHPSTLRMWEEQRLVTPARTPGGDRRFSFRQLEDILRRQNDGRRKQEIVPVPPRILQNVQVRNLEHYRPRSRFVRAKILALVLSILLVAGFWNTASDLTKERLGRVFSPDITNPIVDVNDALEYVVEDDRVEWLRSKFPFLTDFLKVTQDALFNTARFLGAIFFGEGNDYFVSPTGDASFNSVNSNTGQVTSLEVQNLTVTGTTTGVTGTGGGGGGGGIATGGDADTLEGQAGDYYLDLDNETGTCADCLSGAEIGGLTSADIAANLVSSISGVTNDGGNIELVAGANITIIPDDGANTITITSIAGSDADTLDGLDSIQLIRSDTNDSFTAGTLTFNGGTTLDLQGAILNSTGNVTFTDDVDVLGDLSITGLTVANGDVTLGDTAADIITFVGAVSSDILPDANNTWDLGSAALRWGTGYFDTLDANFVAGTITGSGTNANSWTVNQDNPTLNAETSSLAFETGTGDFNAVLQWNASGDPGRFAGYDDNFLVNYPISIISQVSGGNQTFTAGSLFNYGQPAAHAITQTGAFTGIDLDFSANITVPDSSAGNQTGVLITLQDGGASATAIGFQTAGTMDYGLDIGGTVGVADIRLANGETIDNFVNGTIGVVGNLSVGGTITATSTVQGTQLISTVATGTAPLTVASTTKVANLNADLFDDLNSDQFLRSDTNDSFTGTGTLTTDSGTTVDINGTLAWGGATVTEALNMNTQIIENIGNAGTDFDINGGLTLAGDLTVTGGEIFLTPTASSGSTSEGTIYYDSDNDKLFVYANGAFARLATDMTKYTATDAALANAGYVEIAHNQSTNDLSLTAWYFDSLLGQWRTIENFSTTVKQALQNEFDDAPSGALTRTETVGEVGGSNIRISGNLDMGNGSDGVVTFIASTDINATDTIAGRVCAEGGDAVNYSVTGLTANTATLSSSPSSGCLVANDKVLLISLQGVEAAYTNVGNYEILEIQSVVTTTVTFKTNKVQYYGDTAGSDTNIGTAITNQRVMLQRIPQYTSVTVNTGVNVTPTGWNGTKGGVLAFMANGAVTLNGTGTINANADGFAGAPLNNGVTTGFQGESTDETQIRTTANNPQGGGGGGARDGGGGPSGGGGGGGYGTAGTTGGTDGTTPGAGGGTYGDSALDDLYLGSGGGAGGDGTSGDGCGGGNGGGVTLIMANSITVTGGISANGGAGVASCGGGGGGGGSGGSVKLFGKTLALGSSIVTASAGAGGAGNLAGGAGGVGRIAIFYTDSRTGATSPGATETQSGIFPYGLYHSAAIPTSNSTALDNLRWEANLPANANVEFQTRTGNSTDPTDGTWEDWKPESNQKVGGCGAPNCLLLESADTHTNWVGTNATVVEGDTTRNLNFFEDEDETTVTNITKITSSTNGGYAEATIASTDISSYDYLTFWTRASQTGTILRFGFGEAAATEQTEEITIDTTNVWQKVYWDLSDIAAASRNGVTKLRITNLTTAANTIYLDNVRAEKLMTDLEGTQIASTPNNHFQYRAILTTTDTADIPEVENVSLVYNSGYRINQPDSNTVRLYNYTGEEQNVRLEAIVFGADLAEWYPVDDQSIAAGDIVSISGTKDDAGIPKIRKPEGFAEGGMIGIISTRAGLELGIPREDRRLVGLAGRVPVKIAPDSGAITAGDLLTSSGTYPGMAQKLNSPGFAVAKALEGWEPGSGIDRIDAFLAVSWADPGVVVDSEGDAAEVVEEEPPTVDSPETETTDDSQPATEEPAGDPQDQEEEPITQKIITPQIESDEGIFQRLTVAVEAIFEKITAKTAEIASALIDSLTARFIKTDEIEAGKVKVSAPSVGVVTIPAGETVFLVEYQDIQPESKVFLTPEEPLPLGVTIKESEGFEIKLKDPLEIDLKVSYWVIN